jgi:hypothetical protein
MDGRRTLRPSSSGSSSLRNAGISTLRPSSSLSVVSTGSAAESRARIALSASGQALERSINAPFAADRPASALAVSDFRRPDGIGPVKVMNTAPSPARLVTITTPPLSARRRIEHSPIRTTLAARNVSPLHSTFPSQARQTTAAQQTGESECKLEHTSLVSPSDLEDEDSQKLLRAISIIEDLDRQLDEMEKVSPGHKLCLCCGDTVNLTVESSAANSTKCAGAGSCAPQSPTK